MMRDPTMPWKTVIKSATDLVTIPEATRAGFAEQVAAKAEAARPFIEQATALEKALEVVSDVEKLLELTEHRESIAAACGLSTKARGHLRTEEEALIRQALMTLYAHTKVQFPEDASNENIAVAFRKEIVFRYLLTKGDTLGGSMRNRIGAMGAAKLSAAILKTLEDAGYDNTEVSRTSTGKVQSIAWDSRLILFDRTPTLRCGSHSVECNNIDIILLDTSQNGNVVNVAPTKGAVKSLLEISGNYMACGELKSGIDPAGADEHWKTTGSALDRISQDFAGCGQQQPKLFFIGGAIEQAMAEELYKRLSMGDYSFAANLTHDGQVQSLARWLITLGTQ